MRTVEGKSVFLLTDPFIAVVLAVIIALLSGVIVYIVTGFVMGSRWRKALERSSYFLGQRDALMDAVRLIRDDIGEDRYRRIVEPVRDELAKAFKDFPDDSVLQCDPRPLRKTHATIPELVTGVPHLGPTR